MKPSTKIAKEAIISFVGSGIGDAVRYLFTTILARLVGLEYLGIYSLANSVTQLAEVFAKAGLDGGIVRYVSMMQGAEISAIQYRIRSALKMGLIFSLLFMLIQASLSGWLVSDIFRASPFLKTVIIANAITLPFSVLTLIAAGATQGFKLLKYKVFVSGMLIPVVLLITMVGAYFLSSLEMAIILPSLISSIVGLIVILGLLKRLAGISILQVSPIKFDLEILRFSCPLMLVAVIDTLTYWMDIMMLGYFADAKTVGLYYPAARTTGLLRATLVAIMGIAGPMLAQLFFEKKQSETNDLYKLAVRWIMTLALPIAVLIAVFPSKIMLAFGEQYTKAASVLAVLTAATLIQSFTSVGGTMLTVSGYPKVNLFNSIIVLIVNVALNVLLISRYGVLGAAFATLFSTSLLGLLRTAEVRRLFKLHAFSYKLLKPIAASISACLVLLLAKNSLMPMPTLVTLVLAAIITFLSFGATLWLLKFDKDDREVLMALKIIGKSAVK